MKYKLSFATAGVEKYKYSLSPSVISHIISPLRALKQVILPTKISPFSSIEPR